MVIEEGMKAGWLCGQCLTFSLSAGEAVFARCLSSLKDERVAASKEIAGPAAKFTGDKTAFVEDIRKVGHVSGLNRFEFVSYHKWGFPIRMSLYPQPMNRGSPFYRYFCFGGCCSQE